MIVYKYVVYFSFNDDNKPIVLMNGKYLPCYEIEEDVVTLDSYYNIIHNVYFNDSIWQLEEISEITQITKHEIAIVDFCVINNVELRCGQWVELKEVLQDEEVTKETREFINRASQRV